MDAAIRTTMEKSTLQDLWEAWKRIGKKVGDCQARLILTVFYYLILGPFALAIRLACDPLRLKTRSPRGWISRTEFHQATKERSTKQF
jgi:hypothetical protein